MISQSGMRALGASAALSLGLGVAIMFVAALTPPQPVQAQAAADAGKALFTDKCGACHNLPSPQELLYTRRQWRGTVDEMLYQHGALYNPKTNSGITTSEGDQIVDYLSRFAPRPGQQKVGPGDTAPMDVWSAEPLQSRSFPFTSADALDDFDQSGGVWKVVPSDAQGEGYLKARPDSDTANSVLVEKKDAVTGDLDLQTDFKVFQGKGPIGLVVNYQNSRQFSVVQYDPAAQTVSLMNVSGGTANIITSAALNPLPTAGPGGWHRLRVVAHNNGQSLEIWLDYQKRLALPDPNAAAGAHIGLFAGDSTVAAFRNMTVDIYPPANSPATED